MKKSGCVALLVALIPACNLTSEAPAPQKEIGEVAQASTVGVSLGAANSPETLEWQYLPGLGYYDGTNCDSWPKTATFAKGSDPTGWLSTVLSRYGQGVPTWNLQTLLTRMGATEIPVGKATLIGSKRELALAYGTLTDSSGTSERALLAVDTVAQKGFALQNGWLCTEADLRDSPLNCEEKTTTLELDGSTVSVLAHKIKLGTAAAPIATRAVVIAAPRVRIAPADADGEVNSDVHLIIAADKVYGGDAYTEGESVVARTSKVTLGVIPNVRTISKNPSQADWTASLAIPAEPGLLTIFANEVGGLGSVNTFSPAPVMGLNIGTFFAQPAVYLPGFQALYVRPEAYFNPTTTTDFVITGQVFNGTADHSVSWQPKPTSIRTPSDRGSTSVVISPHVSTQLAVSAADPSVLWSTLKRTDVDALVRKTFDALITARSRNLWQMFSDGKVILIDCAGYLSTPSYKEQNISDTVDELMKYADFTDSTSTHTGVAFAASQATTEAQIGAELFSGGVLANQLYAQAENESLRTGVLSPKWADAWNAVSDDTLLIGALSKANLASDFGIDPAKRTHAQRLASHLLLSAQAGVRTNALGLPYGSTTQGWYALRNQDSASAGASRSLLAAEGRWSSLATTVSSFQDAAQASFEVQNTAEKQALLGAIGSLGLGLSQTIDTSSAAGQAIGTAARSNARTQSQTLDDLTKALQHLVDLDNQVAADSTSIYGCSPTGDGAGCAAAIKSRLDNYQTKCEDTSGLDWLKTVISIAGNFIPAVKAADGAVKAITGKDIVDGMIWALQNFPPPPGVIPVDDKNSLQKIKDAATQLAQVDQNVKASAALSKQIRDLIASTPDTCPAGGQPAKDLTEFRRQVLNLDSSMQNFSTQIGLVRTQMNAALGNIGYLTAEGDAFEKLQANNAATKSAVQAAVAKVQGELAPSASFSFAGFETDQRALLDNACNVSLTAARTAQADLWLVSQALEASTGRTETSPDLVVPASPAYHLTNGDPGYSDQDQHFGFLVSLWDKTAFTARLNSTGTATGANFMSTAVNRFGDLMNTEICGSSTSKPPTRFVVRKVLTGQALATLAQQHRVDFGIGIDDLVAGGNRHTDGVRGVIAKSPGTGKFDQPLAGAFVVGAGYSVCKGPAGNECCPTCRVPTTGLGGVGAGAFNNLHLASRGHGYSPVASDDAKLLCDTGTTPVTSTLPILLDGQGTSRVSACLVSKTTSRIDTALGSWDDAAGPDTQVLQSHFQSTYCSSSPETLVLGPLQGLPLLGDWALATTATDAATLDATSDPAPVITTALPNVAGATGVEVLLLVGAEPRNEGQPLDYSLTDLLPTPVGFVDGFQQQGDDTNIFPSTQVRLSSAANGQVARTSPIAIPSAGSYTLTLRYLQPHATSSIAKIGIQRADTGATLVAFPSNTLTPTGLTDWGKVRVNFNATAGWPSSVYARVQYVSGEIAYLDAVWVTKN